MNIVLNKTIPFQSYSMLTMFCLTDQVYLHKVRMTSTAYTIQLKMLEFCKQHNMEIDVSEGHPYKHE